MPYVTDDARYELRTGQRAPETSGELNYWITAACTNYLNTLATLDNADELRYEHVNTVVGALECAKQEIYRRVASPLEMIKCSDNGDVYPEHLTQGGVHPAFVMAPAGAEEDHPHCGTDDCCGGC